MLRVPSMRIVGRALIAPSNAAFTRAPESRSLIPERSPFSAERKSPSVKLASIG